METFFNNQRYVFILNGVKMSLKLIIITPARNEGKYIEKTIKSVISQSLKPIKWIIVDDGSTDNTYDIVNSYSQKYDWIDVIKLPTRDMRHFAGKVYVFNEGYEKIKHLPYDVIGNLDADISFDENYFKFLIDKFSEIPKLGVAGTPFKEENYSSLKDGFEGEKHVAGGCQLFRRECFEEIGGYIPNEGGGIDWIAVTTARMKGWITRSFQEKSFFHYRSLGTGESNTWTSFFKYGKKDYLLGNHPIWELLRIAYRMTKKPFIIGGFILFYGYFSSMLFRVKRPISNELLRFHRKEQKKKLMTIIINILTFKKIDHFYLNS